MSIRHRTYTVYQTSTASPNCTSDGTVRSPIDIRESTLDTEGSNSLRLRGYSEAAAFLKVEESWLRRHIKKLPHTKIGGRVLFTGNDLDRIISMFHHDPEASSQNTGRRKGDSAHQLSPLRPVPRSARQAR